MAWIKRYTITGTTHVSAGSLTEYTDVPVNGKILRIDYVKDATTPLSDGSTMTLTGETSGVAVWAQTGVNASATVYPRTQVHSTAGVGLTLDGTRTACEPIPIYGERLKMVIASGGNSKVATWYVYVE